MRTSLFGQFPDREDTSFDVWDDREVKGSVGDHLIDVAELVEFAALCVVLGFFFYIL